MALPMKKAAVISIETACERRSEVRDLLRKSRLEQLRVAIEEGQYTVDLESIAEGVIRDID